MAHECPDCGQACYCGGDIDDCQFDGTPEQMSCSHCEDSDKEFDDDPTEIEDNRQFETPISNPKSAISNEPN